MTTHFRHREADRRVVIAVAITGLHIGIILWLMLTRQPVHLVVEPSAMIVASIPEPDDLLPAVDAPIDVGLLPPAIEIAASAGSLRPSCDVPAALSTALQTDPSAMVALATIAAEPERAIMVWNQGWTKVTEAQPLRHAVGVALQAASAYCLDEAMIGPRLVFVPADETTVTIAFGSGAWSWRTVYMSITHDK